MNLAEFALIAAILNSPGLFDPFKHPESAIKRRKLVLDRMLTVGHITKEEHTSASREFLPTKSMDEISDTSPYFVSAVLKQASALGIDTHGTTIFSTLSLKNQSYAQKAIQTQLSRLESTLPRLKQFVDKKIFLEATLISMDHETGWISAAVGGRSFKHSQFNRLTDGKRQIGSLIKPILYAAAFEKDDTLSPVSMITDEKFEYKYENQKWSPENYDHRFYGEVPIYYAFKKSLNASAAALGLKTGVDKIVELARRMGVESAIAPVPATTLGAVELKIEEVMGAYATIANLGTYIKPTFIRNIFDESGSNIF